MPGMAKIFQIEAVFAPNRGRLIAVQAGPLNDNLAAAGSTLLSFKQFRKR